MSIDDDWYMTYIYMMWYIADAYADTDADAVTPSTNTRSILSSPGRSFLASPDAIDSIV